jgi:hypothetical protein
MRKRIRGGNIMKYRDFVMCATWRPLSARDAIRAMLDGEILRDEDDGLRRHVKHKRFMTRWEVLDWANSEASRGWVVCIESKSDDFWEPPQCLGYNLDIKSYRRARLLPDLSGVDESTIQGFEVEE